MRRSQGLPPNRQGLSVERLGLGELPLAVQAYGQIMQSLGCSGRVRAVRSSADGERPFEANLGFPGPVQGKEIVRQESKGKSPSFKRILTAVGVDRTNGEVWVALYNTLLHFDKEGNRRATYKIYTPQGARLEGNTILVEQDRLIVGSDPLGIYEFERPDKKILK